MNWYPPAPREGPLSMLDLPADDWAIEAKMNGCRVILLDGQVWTRHGTLLSPGKGAARVAELARGLPEIGTWLGNVVQCYDAEWVSKLGTLFLFDLPLLGGDYDHRATTLRKLKLPDHVECVARGTYNLRAFYDAAKKDLNIEGVVLKKRNSLYRKCFAKNTEIDEWKKRRFCWM